VNLGTHTTSFYQVKLSVFSLQQHNILLGGADLLIPSPTHDDSISPKNKEDEEKEIN